MLHDQNYPLRYTLPHMTSVRTVIKSDQKGLKTKLRNLISKNPEIFSPIHGHYERLKLVDDTYGLEIVLGGPTETVNNAKKFLVYNDYNDDEDWLEYEGTIDYSKGFQMIETKQAIRREKSSGISETSMSEILQNTATTIGTGFTTLFDQTEIQMFGLKKPSTIQLQTSESDMIKMLYSQLVVKDEQLAAKDKLINQLIQKII